MRPSKVAKELQGAIAEEQKREAIDAAKKKAVAQHVDYDTLKKMVSVAHLKPLQAPCTHAKHGSLMPAWQLDPAALTAGHEGGGAGGNSSSSASARADRGCNWVHAGTGAAGAATAQLQPPAAVALPRTSQEFAREWRRHCPTAEAKYRLLQQCGAHGLSAIFRVEIDGPLLGQVLQALQQVCAAAPGTAERSSVQQQQQQQQQEQRCVPAPVAAAAQPNVRQVLDVVALLHALTGTGRFDLNARLLDARSKQAAAALCTALEQALLQDPAGSSDEGGSSGPAGPCDGGRDGGNGAGAAAAAGPLQQLQELEAQQAFEQLRHVRVKLRV